MAKLGRQTPTFTNVKYTKTKGSAAIKLYKSTGQKLLKWQELQINGIMATEQGGLWKHMKYGICVSRRNGKGEILAAREMYGLIEDCEKICHTAHRTTTSHDAFNRLFALLKKAGYEEHSKKKKEMPEKSFYASKQYGLEHIEISGGGIIDFRTRTDNGGLGEGFDLLVIDEAQEYTSKQESALQYTVTASPNPQVIMVGTPPTVISKGDVFGKLHTAVWNGDVDPSVGWAEWSIEEQTDDIKNESLWYEYNPSLGTILTVRNIRQELGTGVVDFNIQRLGLWLKYTQKSEVSAAEWDLLEVKPPPELVGGYYIGVKYGRDGVNMAASIASKTVDGRVFVETLDCVPCRQGSEWIIKYFRNPKLKDVAIDGANGQLILSGLMTKYGFKAPIFPKPGEIILANALFLQGITGKTICHAGQESLRNSVSNCEKRPIGSNGGFGFKSISDLYDIAIMDSAMLAHWLAVTAPEEVPAQECDY